MDSYTALKDKTYGIIIFNGTIITLVTLALVQLIGVQITYKIGFKLDMLLIPYVFLISSLLLAIYAYRVASLSSVNSQNLLNEFYCEPKNEILAQLSSRIAKDTEDNKEISKKRTCLITVALIMLGIGV
jgi:nucleosome binding factor SPN SPT16 subunit